MRKLYFVNNIDGYYTFFFNHYNVPKNVEIIPYSLCHPQSFFKKIIHKLFVRFLPLHNPFSHKKMLRLLTYLYPRFPFQSLLNIEDDSVVLTTNITNPNTLMMFRNLLPKKVTFYNHLLNPIQNNAPLLKNPRTIDNLQKKGILFSTFDSLDAAKYNILFRAQFYCHISEDEILTTYKNDVFFCGLAKDREQEIMNLVSTLQQSGYLCNIIIPKSASECLTNEMYIHSLKQCKCLIDINQKDQVGLSRRPLEALFFKKKLITNNPAITSYDFYRPNNIFCLGKDSLDNIRQFMDTPIEDVPQSILQNYTIDHWLQQWITK